MDTLANAAYVEMVRTLLVAATTAIVLLVAGCGGSSSALTTGSALEDVSSSNDEPLFESNVKYELLDALVNRGAVAPVVENFSCTWSSPTSADCTGSGYDNAAEQSQCGYALLPCGPFDARVHAECGDARGHDCSTEVDLVARDG